MNEDCGIFAPFIQFGGENFDKLTKYGQLSGEGCVFPKYVPDDRLPAGRQAPELARVRPGHGQRPAPRRDGDDQGRARPAAIRRSAAVDLTDTTGPANDSYATRHNPFMYFASIIDNKSLCDSHVLSLHARWRRTSSSASTTPNYSMVTPNTCADGHDWPKCQDGSPGRLPRVNAVPEDSGSRRSPPRRRTRPTA